MIFGVDFLVRIGCRLECWGIGAVRVRWMWLGNQCSERTEVVGLKSDGEERERTISTERRGFWGESEKEKSMSRVRVKGLKRLLKDFKLVMCNTHD